MVEIRKPSGEKVGHGFYLVNGGAWPNSVLYSNSQGIRVFFTALTYDFSHACYSGCGAGYIKLKQKQTVLWVPGWTVVVSQTQYTYDSIYYGNLTSVKEWNFYTDSPSSTPDRETDITYLANSPYVNKNIVNRPLTVTVKDSTGTQVAQTIYTYDSTPLTSFTGAVQHDDTNFGIGNSVRGNPTLIQQWVSGSSSLGTTLTYDTTGQLIQSQDPKSNTTTFGYNDAFYNDNGANPPSPYTPANPSHAYLTSVTRPLIGTSSLGYYFGAGKQALLTDENGATAYSHYNEVLDRPTQRQDAAGGWTLLTYPSPGESDFYVGVQDANPSANCTSCKHTETLLDSVGRLSSTVVVSDPGGPVYSNLGYDANGRINFRTNPFRSTNDATYGAYSFYYDTIDRTTQVLQPDNSSTSTNYGPDAGTVSKICPAVGYPVLTTNQALRQRLLWEDSFGRVIEVDEPDSGNNFSLATCYGYDALNNLTSVAQRGGSSNLAQWRARSFVYDGLSRLTAITSPETGSLLPLRVPLTFTTRPPLALYAAAPLRILAVELILVGSPPRTRTTH